MPILELLRLPGLFSAFADILAGYLILRFSGAGEGTIHSLPFLLLASGCLYAAGMVWNDLFDLDEDRRLRPARPLPSRRVSVTGAFFLAAILSLAALMFAMVAGMNSLLVAALLLSHILAYDAGGKRIEGVGPMLMGGCRGLNLLLGMTAHPHLLLHLSLPLLLAGPCLYAIYIAIVTVLGNLEDEVWDGTSEERPPLRGILAVVVLYLALLGQLLVLVAAVMQSSLHPVALGLWGVMLLLLGWGGVVTVLDSSTQAIRRQVGRSLLLIPIFDGALVASAAGWGWGAVSLGSLHLPIPFVDVVQFAGVIIVVAMIIPLALLKRRVSIT